MQVDVYLPNGTNHSFELFAESTAGELKAEAQRRFERPCLTLAFRGNQLEPSCVLSKAGVRDGDSIDAVAV